MQDTGDQCLIRNPLLFGATPQTLQVLMTDPDVDIFRLARCIKDRFYPAPLRTGNGNIRLDPRLDLALVAIENDFWLHGTSKPGVHFATGIGGLQEDGLVLLDHERNYPNVLAEPDHKGLLAAA